MVAPPRTTPPELILRDAQLIAQDVPEEIVADLVAGAVRNLRSQDGPVGTFLLVAPMIAGPGPAADEVRLVVPPIAQDVLEQVLESRHATNSGRGIGAGACREEHRLALAVAFGQHQAIDPGQSLDDVGRRSQPRVRVDEG